MNTVLFKTKKRRLSKQAPFLSFPNKWLPVDHNPSGDDTAIFRCEFDHV
jgi:hypothetical protein